MAATAGDISRRLWPIFVFAREVKVCDTIHNPCANTMIRERMSTRPPTSWASPRTHQLAPSRSKRNRGCFRHSSPNTGRFWPLCLAAGPQIPDTAITHCLASLTVRMGHKQELEGGCQGCFRVRTLAINFYLKSLSKVLSVIRHKGAWSHANVDVRTAFER